MILEDSMIPRKSFNIITFGTLTNLVSINQQQVRVGRKMFENLGLLFTICLRDLPSYQWGNVITLMYVL